MLGSTCTICFACDMNDV